MTFGLRNCVNWAHRACCAQSKAMPSNGLTLSTILCVAVIWKLAGSTRRLSGCDESALEPVMGSETLKRVCGCMCRTNAFRWWPVSRCFLTGENPARFCCGSTSTKSSSKTGGLANAGEPRTHERPGEGQPPSPQLCSQCPSTPTAALPTRIASFHARPARA